MQKKVIVNIRFSSQLDTNFKCINHNIRDHKSGKSSQNIYSSEIENTIFSTLDGSLSRMNI